MSTTVRQASRDAGGGSSTGAAVKRIREQGVRLKYLLMRSAVSAGMLLSVWLVGYYQYNVSWVIVPSFVYVGVAEFRRSRRRKLTLQDEQSLLSRVDELPSWVSTAPCSFSCFWLLSRHPRAVVCERLAQGCYLTVGNFTF